MSLEVTKFDIDGPLLIHGIRHHDERGYFSETYQAEKYSALGLPVFVQDNLSLSSMGVFRGLHWQEAPHAQGKLVTCLRGSIVDFVVDVRPESDTFMRHLEVQLSSKELLSFWVPVGFAHGFLALEDDTLVSYKVSDYWNASAERSLNIGVIKNSAAIRNVSELTLSAKDQAAPYQAIFSGLTND